MKWFKRKATYPYETYNNPVYIDSPSPGNSWMGGENFMDQGDKAEWSVDRFHEPSYPSGGYAPEEYNVLNDNSKAEVYPYVEEKQRDRLDSPIKNQIRDFEGYISPIDYWKLHKKPRKQKRKLIKVKKEKKQMEQKKADFGTEVLSPFYTGKTDDVTKKYKVYYTFGGSRIFNKIVDALNEDMAWEKVKQEEGTTIKKFAIEVISNVKEKKAMKWIKAELKKWKSDSNYMGEDYSDYYVVYQQNRGSDTLAQSNFDVALKMLGGEGDGVLIARMNHWAVGWVEFLLVQQSATEKVKIAEDIVKQLGDYAVLDDEDYSEKQEEQYEQDYKSWARQDAIREIGLTDEQLENPKVEKALEMATMDALQDSGGDGLYEVQKKFYEHVKEQGIEFGKPQGSQKQADKNDDYVKIVKKMKADKHRVSPNNVASVAAELGISLTSDEVVYVSDNFERIAVQKQSASNTVKVEVWKGDDIIGEEVVSDEEFNHFSKTREFPAKLLFDNMSLQTLGLNENDNIVIVRASQKQSSKEVGDSIVVPVGEWEMEEPGNVVTLLTDTPGRIVDRKMVGGGASPAFDTYIVELPNGKRVLVAVNFDEKGYPVESNINKKADELDLNKIATDIVTRLLIEEEVDKGVSEATINKYIEPMKELTDEAKADLFDLVEHMLFEKFKIILENPVNIPAI